MVRCRKSYGKRRQAGRYVQLSPDEPPFPLLKIETQRAHPKSSTLPLPLNAAAKLDVFRLRGLSRQ